MIGQRESRYMGEGTVGGRSALPGMGANVTAHQKHVVSRYGARHASVPLRRNVPFHFCSTKKLLDWFQECRIYPLYNLFTILYNTY